MKQPLLKNSNSLQGILWSKDIRDINLEKDKAYIIHQVLNYGTEREIKWLFNIYPERDIKSVLRRPKRGCWYADVLNYWLRIFDIKLNKNIYELAIREMVSSPKKQKLLERLFDNKLKA